jgi:hypothetical protein
MQKWAFNILINASKKNARRRERLFKYFDDIHVENGIVRFQHTTSTSIPTRVFDVEAQAYTYTETHNGRLVYEDLTVEEQVTLYEPSMDDYEPIDWHT